MNPKFYYHTPIKPTSTRVSCPVCHEPVYSRAGIHPQCAVAQSDPPKLRSKKEQVPGLPEQSIKAADQPAGADRSVLPSKTDVGRVGPQRVGKGTWVRFIK